MPTPEDKIVKIIDGTTTTIQATVVALTNSNPQVVSVVDANGDQIADFGQVEATGFNGAPVTVGTTAVEMTFTGVTQAIRIQSDSTNTGRVWIGASNVTNAGANAIGELMPGQAISVDLNDAAAALYVVSDTAAQNIFKWALT